MHRSPAAAPRLFALVAAGAFASLVAPAGAASGGVSLSPEPVAPAASTPSTPDRPTVPGVTAKLLKDGTAAAPADAPPTVQNAVWWANKIVGKPYRYGGGHARFNDTGYDCSGTISYALRGAKTLKDPLDSTSFMAWGEPGPGTWITVFTRPDHAYVVIAGLRLDTSAAGDPGGQKGPRWRPVLRSDKGFTVRHPDGL